MGTPILPRAANSRCGATAANPRPPSLPSSRPSGTSAPAVPRRTVPSSRPYAPRGDAPWRQAARVSRPSSRRSAAGCPVLDAPASPRPPAPAGGMPCPGRSRVPFFSSHRSAVRCIFDRSAVIRLLPPRQRRMGFLQASRLRLRFVPRFAGYACPADCPLPTADRPGQLDEPTPGLRRNATTHDAATACVHSPRHLPDFVIHLHLAA